MDVYIDPTKCAPCKYRVQFNTLGLFRRAHDLPKLNLIELHNSIEKLPYVVLNGNKIHMSEVTLDKLESVLL